MIRTNRNQALRLLGAALLALMASAAAHGHDASAPSALAATPSPAMGIMTGTVGDLLIDDRVNNTVTHFYTLRLDDGQTVALSGAGADVLSSGARVEVTGSLSGGTLAATHVSVLAASQGAKAGAPAPVPKQVQGTLVIFHKDYFAEERAEYGFGVHDGAGHMTPLNVAMAPGPLRPGMTVAASGTTADGVTLDPSQITILAMPPAQNQPLGVTTTNNVLVMPIKFSDSPASDPFTATAIDQAWRTNATSVAAYYNEVSYGQQAINVTVACATTHPAGCAGHTSAGGWLQSTSATPASCDFTTMGNLADAAATAAGYNVASYNNRFYVLPSIGGCGWAGLAYIGYPYQAWSDGYNALWVYGHELGHNFTLYHAGGVNCAPQVLGGTSCPVGEYADRFDVMGNNSAAGQQMHFNAAQKSLLGWIPPSSVITHTSGTASYTLSPLESAGQSTYAVKIPLAADPSRTYWIEYRQPIGFDSGMASYPNLGAIVHVASPFDYPCTSCGGDDTEILDMTPATAGNFGDAALLVGKSYVDSTYGVNIMVTAASPTALSVTVTAPSLNPTTTTLVSSLNPSTLGGSVTFTASVTGTSPTGTVAFANGGVPIAGCTAAALAGSGNTRTAACATAALPWARTASSPATAVTPGTPTRAARRCHRLSTRWPAPALSQLRERRRPPAPASPSRPPSAAQRRRAASTSRTQPHRSPAAARSRWSVPATSAPRSA